MNALDPESIRKPISGMPGARLEVLEVFSEIESTNSYLLDQPAPAPGRFRVALADYQTAGRGRFDRTWHSPPSSGLCLSMAYTFPQVPARLPGLTLALGIGIVNALHRLGIDGIGLKWPNDIIAHDGKLGGILTEVRGSSSNSVTVVAGIGLNVDLPAAMQSPDTAPLMKKIVDLKDCTANPPSPEKLSIAVIESLFDCMVRFEADGFTPFHDEWQKYDWLFGKQVIVNMPDGHCAGIADGVDDDGALIVRTDQRRRRIINGTVTLLVGPDDCA
jgi:BirA family biotin operon repressor/biotin-[acetyl-CoA-carboxylase] ligase